nr:MarR family transcriptional regulator [Gordonia humi]
MIRVPITILADTLRNAGRERALPSAQAQTLSQLSVGEPKSVTELAAAQERAVSSMTEVVQRLERHRLVRRVDDHGDDRRRVFVVITDEGRVRLRASIAARDALLAERLDELSAQEIASIVAAAPLLWRLARLDPSIWPDVPHRPPRPRRRELT